MTDTIPVVKPHIAKEDAYQAGFARFEGMDEVESHEDFGFHHFTESATWVNVIAPDLRAAAGAEDATGEGTYTAHRQVAAIKPGHEDDEPADAELTNSRHIYEELVDAYRAGAFDAALAGNEYGDTLEL